MSEHELFNAELSLFVMIMVVFQKEGYVKKMGVRSYGTNYCGY